MLREAAVAEKEPAQGLTWLRGVEVRRVSVCQNGQTRESEQRPVRQGDRGSVWQKLLLFREEVTE